MKEFEATNSFPGLFFVGRNRLNHVQIILHYFRTCIAFAVASIAIDQAHAALIALCVVLSCFTGLCHGFVFRRVVFVHWHATARKAIDETHWYDTSVSVSVLHCRKCESICRE